MNQEAGSSPDSKAEAAPEKKGGSLVLSFVMVALVTLVGTVYGSYLGVTNIGMLYLLPVIFASARLGAKPSVIIAITSVLSFDIFFVPPVLKITVDDLRYLITFIVFIVVAFTSGSMADRLRFKIHEALYRESRTRALYELARGLATVNELEVLAGKVVSQVSETVDSEAVLYLPEENGSLKTMAASKAFSDLVLGPNELSAAQWSFDHSLRSGIGTDNYSATKGLFIPVKTDEKTLGVLGIKPTTHHFTPEQITLLEALAGLTALAVVRLELAAEAQAIKTLEASERLRAALFNSVSHDMKTPLASILGAVSSLVDDVDLYNDDQKRTLLISIKQGALRMNRVVGNLLDMARLESGYMQLNTDWCDIQDIIGVTLRENREVLKEHGVKVDIPESIKLIKVDYGLIEQVLTNLLHNAVKYSPCHSEIKVRVAEEPGELVVSVADQGDGVPAGDQERIFDKFYRLQSPGNISGTGLGLSICRGIIEAHGGRIWTKNQPGGGSLFSFALPVDDSAPESGGSRLKGGFHNNGCQNISN
ncbi:MAG TPA: ATP-binding protein [Syntrophomonadaceae bacterium]|nr:ATP-binding protein [Syntrophomonadaceae bacterium]